MFACGSSVHQRCSNYTLTNLLFGLCRSMWVIDLLVNLLSPHQSSSTPPLPLKCCKTRSAPKSFSFRCLHFWIRNWIYQGAWGCVIPPTILHLYLPTYLSTYLYTCYFPPIVLHTYLSTYLLTLYFRPTIIKTYLPTFYFPPTIIQPYLLTSYFPPTIIKPYLPTSYFPPTIIQPYLPISYFPPIILHPYPPTYLQVPTYLPTLY